MLPRKLSLILGLLAMFGAGPLLSACNTVEGVGEDTSAAGRAISNTAEDTKKAL